MAKACDCSVILEAYENDPRLLALPLAVRGLWLALVLRMRRMGLSVLMLGSAVPNLRQIAMLVPMAETELETQLDALLVHGMLVRREDGALESPLLAARQKRAETARINGLKGGRPRKDGTPAGQRSIMLPIAGGLGEADAKTHGEPGADASVSPAKLAKPSEEKAKQAELPAPAEWNRICAEAMEAAGFDPVRWTGTCGWVATWWREGASEALILGTIRRVMARGNVRPDGFKYFNAAIREAMAAEGAGQPVAVRSGAADSEESKAWAERMRVYVANGCQGPMPVRGHANAA